MIAAKFLLPALAAGAALFAFGGKSHASTATAAKPGGKPATNGKKLNTAQVVDAMTKAIATGDPAVLNALADRLEAQGFKAQAADLRGVAQSLGTVGAVAAGVTPAPAVSSKPTTAPAAIPQAAPSPSIVMPPPPAPQVQTLPTQTITASVPTSAANRLASDVVLDQQSHPKWKDNRDLVSTFQTQESALGHYVNVLTGAPGKVDGLYGPGTALAIAEYYGIVPPSPKYWPTNSAPSLKAYRARLLQLAAADPARAAEWQQAAQKAKA